MYTHLRRHGNAYALVLDKSLRAILGITPETMLRLWTDGRRLVVEPEHAPRLVTPPEELTLRQIVLELFETHGMTRDHVTAIHALARPCFSPVYAVGWADGLANVATERDVAIKRRYHALLRARRAGVPWDAALPSSLLEFPLPASVPGG